MFLSTLELLSNALNLVSNLTKIKICYKLDVTLDILLEAKKWIKKCVSFTCYLMSRNNKVFNKFIGNARILTYGKKMVLSNIIKFIPLI